MWAGTSALHSIDQNLHTIRQEVLRLDTHLSGLGNDMATNRRHKSQLLNDIAAIRLAAIDSGKLHASLSAADTHVEKLLSQRDASLRTLTQEIELINVQLQNAETQRGELLEKVNAKSQQIVDIEGEVQHKLKMDSFYLAQFERAKQAESVSSSAQRKSQSAHASLSEKASPYKSDDLFMYLWEREYGTTEYSANPFTRFIDGWLAKVIRYEPSRVNFWNLTEIPKRLAAHASKVESLAQEQHAQLQLLELKALQEAGINDAESQLTNRRDDLDTHDDALEEFEALLNQKLSERSHYVSGSDEYMQQSLAHLSQALEHQTLQSVYHYVRDTVSHTDDLLVVELQSLEDALDHVEDDLADVRALHNTQLAKLKELEQVRRDFKNSRFDDVRSGFGNQALIMGVLQQFAQGAMSGSDVWRVIKRNQRYQQVASSPSFGSGALGGLLEGIGDELLRQSSGRGRRRSSSWHFPKPRRGGGGFNIPKSGSGGRRGGGFTTGGGF